MNYKELIEQLRYESGPVARDEAANSIESLLAENERLKAELSKYRDAPVVAWREFDGEGGYDYRSYDDNEDFRSEYRKRNPSKIYHDWVQPLIVKPGE